MFRKKLLGDQEPWLMKYESSMEEDREIVFEVLTTLKIHVEELKNQKLINNEQFKKIIEALNKLEGNVDKVFENEAEDIHEAIEIELEKMIGEEAKLISLGKSRNDHVSTAIKLHTIKEINEIIDEINRFRRVLLKKSKENLETIMPSFTHLQSAQPTTLAHYLMYIEEEMEEYQKILKYVNDEVINKSPLGAGAITGSIISIDRKRMAEKLKMKSIEVNTIKATGSRSFMVITSSILTALQITLSRIAEDLIIWSTNQFNYIQLPDNHLATSSLMPHKRNPVTMEIIRAQAGEAIGGNTAIMTILKGLPSGYNLDLQEATKHLWNIIKNIKDSLKVMCDAMKNMKINIRRMRQDVENTPVIATEVAEYISFKYNIPYRRIHEAMAEALKEAKNDIYEALEILRKRLELKENIPMRIQEYVKMKENLGSPNPNQLIKIIEEKERILGNIELSR
ncbi:MAG: argininosuccinate lyase [Candidatus Methanomethylicia archaeon]|nr:argininosuccinate lyase [Candidatus Methanomethylicia archaeon]